MTSGGESSNETDFSQSIRIFPVGAVPPLLEFLSSVTFIYQLQKLNNTLYKSLRKASWLVFIPAFET